MKRKSTTVLILTLTCFFPNVVSADPLRPAPVTDNRQAWMGQHSRQQRALLAEKHQVCLLGDSVTAGWPKQQWNQQFADFKLANCGIAGDRIEQMHYRARMLNLANAAPEVFVIQGGSDNLGSEQPDDPRDVAQGILRTVNALRLQYPQSKFVVISVLPSGQEPHSDLRKSIRKVNEHLQRFQSAGQFQFLNVHDRFVLPTGHWRPGLTVDGSKLSDRGYGVLGESLVAQLKPILEQLKQTESQTRFDQ